MRKIGCACLLAVAAIAPAAEAAERYGSRTLREGAQGKDVRVLQRYLTRSGFRASADGHFGRGTKRAVRRWEASRERRRNGVVTRAEARLIRSDARTSGQATTDPDSSGGSEAGSTTTPGESAELTAGGLAVAPASAPPEVRAVIEAGNEIAKKPYRYGGGHGSWRDSGYDCSGSLSYALHGGGFLRRPLDSTGFMSWAEAGRGEWITAYANSGHAYMVVAGLRFDTSGLRDRGSRWTDEMRSARGYTARHPEGF